MPVFGPSRSAIAVRADCAASASAFIPRWPPSDLYESAEVRVDGGGKVAVVSGAAPQGQGTGTALAQVVADQLEVPLEQITVTFADTARIPFGVGTYASRNAVMAGSATLVASQRVRDKAIAVAANPARSQRGGR